MLTRYRARNVDHLLIGYDLRQPLGDIEPWDDRRRATYLLREDVKKPLSTDLLVWPRQDAAIVNILPNLRENWFGLLNTAPAPEAASDITSSVLSGYSAVQVGFSVCLDGVGPEDLQLLKATVQFGGDIAALSNDRTTLIGFDVSDSSLLSGLMSCGYKPDRKSRLAQRWSPMLNRYHLFGRAQDAVEFARVTGERVPEHSPFFAYGIWIIGKKQRNRELMIENGP